MQQQSIIAVKTCFVNRSQYLEALKGLSSHVEINHPCNTASLLPPSYSLTPFSSSDLFLALDDIRITNDLP